MLRLKMYSHENPLVDLEWENLHYQKQLIKLVGLNLKENTSGMHKGQTKITKRGRRKLRAYLFRVILPLVSKNRAFKMQTLIALRIKLIRVIFNIMKKDHEFSEVKMLQEILRLNVIDTAAYLTSTSWTG
uniref:transposase n=1 Tax=Paenibacillus nasutitermitis TaxID=1652958 RepID=UPI003570F2E7